MNAPDDAALLRRFVHQTDETAFRTLVERHLPLVHASATRQLEGDAHLAEDVAQKVFALLATRAKRLLDHPTLAGWLFTTTRNLAHAVQRSRARRVFHENRSAMSSEPTPPRENEPSWAEFTPVLDEALADLGDRDREGVLLRFFENRSYVEIGACFGLSENAARMRVERSLEKLRRLLLRRGVAATAGTLAGSLAAHGAPALAADLATRVAAQALSASASAGGGAGVIVFMSKAKITTSITVLAIGVAIYEGTEARTQSRRAEESERRARIALEQLAEQRAAVAAATQRLQAADEDNAHLLAAIAQAKGSFTAKAERVEGAKRFSRAEVERRFEQAKQLAKAGRSEEAMKEYLWCYDQGMTAGFTFMGARGTLIEAMGELAKTYPPMREALQERRKQAEQAMLTDAEERDQVVEFATLSNVLGDTGSVLDAFAKLPRGDDRRGTLLNFGAYDQLLAQRRYGEIVAERSFEHMRQNFDLMKVALMPGATEEVRKKFRRDVVGMGAKNVEVLAGAGQLENARALAARILEYDSSAEARATLASRLERSGHSDLVKQ